MSVPAGTTTRAQAVSKAHVMEHRNEFKELI